MGNTIGRLELISPSLLFSLPIREREAAFGSRNYLETLLINFQMVSRKVKLPVPGEAARWKQ